MIFQLRIYVMALLVILLAGGSVLAQKECAIKNTAFGNNEKITYVIYYNVIGAYISAGTASFSTKETALNGKPVYHVVGEGATNSSYDLIFKVRDKYESFIDSETMQPLKFVRNVNEGGYKIYQNVAFNKTANTATSNDGVYKVPVCVQDVISAVYYARNIDFKNLKAGDRITFSMFLDNELHSMYIKYMGKEVIKTKYGKFRTHKFKPLLIKGTIFEGGEKMTVWVTDDENKVPVRIESPIIVGKVKVDMMGHQNLRNPLVSLIKRN